MTSALVKKVDKKQRVNLAGATELFYPIVRDKNISNFNRPTIIPILA
jgi:hypothetical protein